MSFEWYKVPSKLIIIYKVIFQTDFSSSAKGPGWIKNILNGRGAYMGPGQAAGPTWNNMTYVQRAPTILYGTLTTMEAIRWGEGEGG